MATYRINGVVDLTPVDTPPIVYPPGPVDPGYSPPWARPQPPVIGGGPIYPSGPIDPGYSPPWARPPVDPGYSPPWARPQPPVIGGGPIYPSGPVDPGFGNPWFDPHPSHPIMLPGMPGFGGGGQDSRKIVAQIPPDITAPPMNPTPTDLPDLASPGFWAYLINGSERSVVFVQTALNMAADHTPRYPDRGIPGSWMLVMYGDPPVILNAWVPSAGAPPVKTAK